jgi:hypothetical protein
MAARLTTDNGDARGAAGAEPRMEGEPADAAIEFLDRLRPGGPRVLTAIVPDGGAPTVTITALNADAVRAFVREYDGQRNLYYSANPTTRALTSKASKNDIAAAEYLFADLDPRDDESPEAAKARYLERLDTFDLRPTFIVDSGNGLQVLWRLATAMGPDKFAEVEARTKATIIALGGPPGTQNVDRVLRLPGTTNLPNAKKRKAGRVPCATALLSYSDIAHPLDAFPVPEAPKGGGGSPKLTSNPVPLLTVDVDELRCSDRIRAMIRTGEDTENPAVPFADCRSERAFAVLVALAAAGCDDATVAVIEETDKGGLYVSGRRSDGKMTMEWLPRSLVKMVTLDNGLAEIKIPGWLVKEKGMAGWQPAQPGDEAQTQEEIPFGSAPGEIPF